MIEKNQILAEYSFDLPEELIATTPPEKRDQSRLMVIDRKTGEISHHEFLVLPSLLHEGDLLIRNDTKVSKKRLSLRRKSGAKLTALLLERESSGWKALILKSGRLKEGEDLILEGCDTMLMRYSLKGILTPIDTLGNISLTNDEEADEFLSRYGEIPIPHYMGRPSTELDEDRYQTIYAQRPGSAAAPTAGFHFTEKINQDILDKGVIIESLTLQIGYGTFAPLNDHNFVTKTLHKEAFEIPSRLEKAYQSASRKIAIGTTTLRALESNYREWGTIKTGNYVTEIFLYPPDKIQSVDALLTNFHLPGSSLFLLVCCLLGRDVAKEAYKKAIEKKYRFYSYGDAMLIL